MAGLVACMPPQPRPIPCHRTHGTSHHSPYPYRYKQDRVQRASSANPRWANRNLKRRRCPEPIDGNCDRPGADVISIGPGGLDVAGPINPNPENVRRGWRISRNVKGIPATILIRHSNLDLDPRGFSCSRNRRYLGWPLIERLGRTNPDVPFLCPLFDEHRQPRFLILPLFSNSFRYRCASALCRSRHGLQGYPSSG